VNERARCSKCGTRVRILVYRREGSSGTKEPETWLCGVCGGERPEPKERT
jgi:hypothetical protein